MNRTRSMSLNFFILLILCCTSLVSAAIDKHDETALLKLKMQLGDPSSLSAWVEGVDLCLIGITGPWTAACAGDGHVNVLLMNKVYDITVPFPDAICDLTELHVLIIDQFPGLYGPIPSCLTQLINLDTLVIIETSLSGPVPSFTNQTNLGIMALIDSKLSGTIPPSLSTLPKLFTLNLAGNNLTGTIPPEIVQGSFSYLNLSGNSLTGELPRCYGLIDFNIIDVRGNHLTGDASFLFGAQKYTVGIYLANNEFEFDLSNVEFSDYINSVDLSHNKIYGKVPDSFATARLLSFADLSFNRLCGELPTGGNIGRFDAAVFANNSCLCGYPLPPCSAPPPAPEPYY